MDMNLKRIETYETFCVSEVETNDARSILVAAANADMHELLRYVQHGEERPLAGVARPWLRLRVPPLLGQR